MRPSFLFGQVSFVDDASLKTHIDLRLVKDLGLLLLSAHFLSPPLTLPPTPNCCCCPFDQIISNCIPSLAICPYFVVFYSFYSYPPKMCSLFACPAIIFFLTTSLTIVFTCSWPRASSSYPRRPPLRNWRN